MLRDLRSLSCRFLGRTFRGLGLSRRAAHVRGGLRAWLRS